MLEWEANMYIETPYYVVPELFVKCIEPGESFNIIAFYEDGQNEMAVNELDKHILICRDVDFLDSQIKLPFFLNRLQEYDFEYPYSFVVLDSRSIHSFIQSKRLMKATDKH